MVTTRTALIHYVQDYDPLGIKYQTNTTQVNLPGCVHKYIKVAHDSGMSTDFLITLMYEALEKCQAVFTTMETN